MNAWNNFNGGDWETGINVRDVSARVCCLVCSGHTMTFHKKISSSNYSAISGSVIRCNIITVVVCHILWF